MNRDELLQKIATSSFGAGGILNAAQSDKFVNYVFDQSVLKGSVRMIKMNEPIQEIDKIGVGNRVAKPKVEATAPSAGQFVGITTGKIVLTTSAIIVPWKISFETLEDNIERDGFEDTMLQMISAQLSNDLEELGISGDTASGDAYLALQNGWLKLMATGGHDVTLAASTSLNKTVFSKLKRAMPSKYMRRYSDFRFFVNPNDEQDYRDSLAARDTNYGDATLQGDSPITVYGIKVVPVPLMPQGTVILTHLNNLIMAMRQSGIRLEKDKDIYSGENLYAIHCRVAYAIENTDACVFTNDVVAAV